jgi:hypothetical protein
LSAYATEIGGSLVPASIEKSSHHIDKGYTVSIAEVIEDHIRNRMVREKDRARESAAAEELIGILHLGLT